MGFSNNTTRKAKGAGGLSHGFWMAVCCLAPVALIAVLAYSGVSLKGFGLLAVLLLCPIMHFLMMRKGHHGHEE
jgi:hypothetical protein